MAKLRKSLVSGLSGIFGVSGKREALSLNKNDKVMFTLEKLIPYGKAGKKQACLGVSVNGKDRGFFSVGVIVNALVASEVTVNNISYKDNFTPSRSVTESFMRTLYKSE